MAFLFSFALFRPFFVFISNLKKLEIKSLKKIIKKIKLSKQKHYPVRKGQVPDDDRVPVKEGEARYLMSDDAWVPVQGGRPCTW